MDRNIEKKAKKEIKKAKTLKELNRVFKNFLGKKGEVSLILRGIKDLPKDKRKKEGQAANQLKNQLEKIFKKKEEEIKKKESTNNKSIDVTIPGVKVSTGHLHPLTQVQQEASKIFKRAGFKVVEGPQIENEWYNFDALNFPNNHPARDIQDTLFLNKRASKKGRFLMRTHTSPVQVRYMEKHEPPLKIVVPGRVFRHEATDSRHEINFYQFEGLMVGKDISVVNLKTIMTHFLRRFLKDNQIKTRFRPGFFPFTEPSFEIDCTCPACKGEGGKCSTCSGTGWMELLGAGMVHPNVLRNAGVDPEDWQGFAFGVGIDRLAMLKYKINDIRLFYNSSLKFLKQF
jgi:phenylalanyl-tRNA synthetase alpha chain